MPELPEVETVRRVLVENILNNKITDILIYYPKMINNDLSFFKANVINQRIINIGRKGKYLLFELENDYCIISHLRMEGKFFYVDSDFEINKHIHIVFVFENGKRLCYQDVRKFGRMELKSRDVLFTTNPLNTLGKEPFEADGNYLFDLLKNKNISIKTTLLDQTILLGLGNIYVDEVLFEAKILPNKSSKMITLDECNKIVESACNILQLAITKKGTTIRSYTSQLNVTGEFQNYLKVHTKQECKVCGNNILKIKIGGRGTYYCPNCQK